MSDSYTEVTRQSWGSRMKVSFKGILTGILLILIGIVLLFWNEGRTVNNKRALKEGIQNVVHVESDKVNPSLEGKLVHFSGFADTKDVLTDQTFGISQTAISIHRFVQMYQWDEETSTTTKKNVGGSEETVTTYNYNKKWSSELINSNDFKIPANHNNPDHMKYESYSTYTANVMVGDFKIPGSLIQQISKSQNLETSKLDISGIPEASIYEGEVYIGTGNFATPQIGDLRVGFTLVGPQDVSVVGSQTGNTVKEYVAQNNKSFMLLTSGIVTAEEMFQNEMKSNNLIGWILRLLGFLLISSGFIMIFKPMVVLADTIPFIGNIVNFGTGLVGGILGFGISLIVISIAWIYYRPVMGISILLLGVSALVYFIVISAKKKKK